MPVQSKTTTSREEMMLHVAPLNIQSGQNREHGTSPAWPGANPSADLIVGLDKSSLVFLNRWHHGQSSAEHWGDADDALRVWGAKHGTPGPQYLHPWVPKKHTAADQSHHGKGKQLPDQRWVHCKSFLPQMCERVPVTKTEKYRVCFQRLLFFLSKDVVLLLCLWTSTVDLWFRLGSKNLKVWGVFAPLTFTWMTGSTYCTAETLDYFNCQCFWSDGEIIYWLISDTYYSKPFMLFEIQTWELLAFLPITQGSNSTFPYTICSLDLQLFKDLAKCIALRSNRGCNTDRKQFSQACFPSCVFPSAFLIYIADFSSHNWSFSECTTDLTCTSHYTLKCVLL